MLSEVEALEFRRDLLKKLQSALTTVALLLSGRAKEAPFFAKATKGIAENTEEISNPNAVLVFLSFEARRAQKDVLVFIQSILLIPLVFST